MIFSLLSSDDITLSHFHYIGFIHFFFPSFYVKRNSVGKEGNLFIHKALLEPGTQAIYLWLGILPIGNAQSSICPISGVTWTSCTSAWNLPRSSYEPPSRPSPAASAPTLSSLRGLSSTAPLQRLVFPQCIGAGPCLLVASYDCLSLPGHSRCHVILQASISEPAQQTPAQVLCVFGKILGRWGHECRHADAW